MKIFDVNILIYAHRKDMPQFEFFQPWLSNILSSEEPFGISELVLSSFIRIVTNPRAYPTKPTPTEVAIEQVKNITNLPNCMIIRPGLRHFEIFTRLCLEVKATGNMVPDAYLAALAIESNCEWVTMDRGFAKFPNLRWSCPI